MGSLGYRLAPILHDTVDRLNPRSDFVHYVHTALVDPDRGVKIGLNYSSWGVFGPPKAPVASERAMGAYLVPLQFQLLVDSWKWAFSPPRAPGACIP